MSFSLKLVPPCALLLLIAAALTAWGPAGAPAADGWVSLFDGKSLDGWHVSCKPGDRGKDFWSVRDGAITCDARGRGDHDYVWLISDNEYDDFELKFKVRAHADSTGNSGMQFRSRYDDTEYWLDGPQADVHPPTPWRTGLIYDETRETKRWIFPSLPNAKIDESYAVNGWTWNEEGWNEVRIICRGTHVKTFVNGNPTTDKDLAGILDDEAHRKHDAGLRGHFAIQLHTKSELHMQYKDIFVRPLK